MTSSPDNYCERLGTLCHIGYSIGSQHKLPRDLQISNPVVWLRRQWLEDYRGHQLKCAKNSFLKPNNVKKLKHFIKCYKEKHFLTLSLKWLVICLRSNEEYPDCLWISNILGGGILIWHDSKVNQVWKENFKFYKIPRYSLLLIAFHYSKNLRIQQDNILWHSARLTKT